MKFFWHIRTLIAESIDEESVGLLLRSYTSSTNNNMLKAQQVLPHYGYDTW
jgi:hypothetical protein